MKKIIEGIYQWSSYSEEKGLNFNGLYLQTEAGPILVDPPPMGEEDLSQVVELGIPKHIFLTNKHHTRSSGEYREKWGAKLLVPEDDQKLMEIPVDGTYSDGELVGGEIEVVNIPDSKTPGECALFWPKKRTLIIGDAMIGLEGGLAMLPNEKFKNPDLAKQGLKVLRGLDYDVLLLGDGDCILENAQKVVEEFIDRVSS